VPWRSFFADEGLQRIIEAALTNNRDLRLAALNVERTQALYGIARADLLPAVNVAGRGSKGRVPADLSNTGRAATNEQYSVSLGISSWEIDFFGRLRNLRDKALEEFLATDQARRGAQILLVSSVSNACLTLAADRETLQLAEATLTAQEEAFRIIQKRRDAGMASELDLRRAQSAVETARGDVARYTQLVAQDTNVLNLLVGSPVPAAWLPPSLAAIRPLRDISPGLSSDLLLRRPDILAAEHRLKGAYANIGAARAAFFPESPCPPPSVRQAPSSPVFSRTVPVPGALHPRSVLPFSMPVPGRPTG
jgi:multidrug efflux system outer membrane protein